MPAGAAEAVALLRRPETIRTRCHALLALAEAGRLPHFTLQPERMATVVGEVVDTIRARHPDLAIPYHARWRHFAAGGQDRWAALAASDRLAGRDRAAVARLRIELCVVSVLLDAGAGPGWAYAETATGQVLRRSEGLAVASLDAFQAGLFAAEPARDRLRADAAGLARLEAASLGRAFQVGPNNPLDGLEGRAALMRNLGAAVAARPDLFREARLGGLYDHLLGQAGEAGLPARAILAALLDAFSPVWPGRLALGGIGLGDVWAHPLAAPEGPAPGLVPFHKLSQWLAYSLVEVFEQAGLPVTRLDDLTGLPEYRNGGLLLDGGLLALRDPGLATVPLPVDHPAIVEWRALTVALLDRLAGEVRARVDRPAMPLACILEGGTWAAGRRIAARLRPPEGGPPLRVLSDGTVF